MLIQHLDFFKFSKLNSDIFINKKTEYEYSYGRRKILSSENNIGKAIYIFRFNNVSAKSIQMALQYENLY